MQLRYNSTQEKLSFHCFLPYKRFVTLSNGLIGLYRDVQMSYRSVVCFLLYRKESIKTQTQTQTKRSLSALLFVYTSIKTKLEWNLSYFK